MMKPAHRIVVSIDRQQLSLFGGRTLLRTWPVSSASRGIGFDEGSCRTPTGRFIIRERIGDGHPPGTIFVARRPVGIWSPGRPGDKDLVLTRILRLDGIDPENSNSWDRYIYIHGTNQEELLGSPASMGCIRMANRDIIELFPLVGVGTPVEIIAPNQPGTRASSRHPGREYPESAPEPALTIRKMKRKLYVTTSSDSHYPAAVMATTKDAKKGKRYTPQEKEEILAFVAEVNSKNKRGGQKIAAEKFNISPLTISNWLKATKKKVATKEPAEAKVVAKKTAKKKAAKKKAAKKKAAKRGRPAKKKAAKRGRPAKKKAAKRGRPAKKKAAKRGRPAAVLGGFPAKLRKLADHNDAIAKAEAGLAKLKAEFIKLKASL